jgi:hypothetical protein
MPSNDGRGKADAGRKGSFMLTRRGFLARFGGSAAAAAAIYALPEVLQLRGWWNAAYALELNLVLDTFNALAAMVWPGNDDYSVAQGESSDRPGAFAANAGHHMINTLDDYLPYPDTSLSSNDRTVPLSASIASGINAVALTVNPLAASGTFLTPFARLTFAEKAATWRVLEEGTQVVTGLDPTLSLGVLQFVFGVLPSFVQFFAFSEIDVFDSNTRTLRRRPVGWDHAQYLGDLLEPPEGWDEFKGFYQGRREVER